MAFVNAIQLIVAVLLMIAILLQQRGTGLSTAFGGEGNVYRTKRGLEKSLFRVTVALAVIFLGTALANTVLQRSGNIRPAASAPTALETPLPSPEVPQPSATPGAAFGPIIPTSPTPAESNSR